MALTVPRCPEHKTVMKGAIDATLRQCARPGCQWEARRHRCRGRYALSDGPTRASRKATHAVFDLLWSDGHMRRRSAYRKLAKHLGMPLRRCHIRLFTVQQCDAVQTWACDILAKAAI